MKNEKERVFVDPSVVSPTRLSVRETVNLPGGAMTMPPETAQQLTLVVIVLSPVMVF